VWRLAFESARQDEAKVGGAAQCFLPRQNYFHFFEISV
jgi:hypothetical protein